MRILFIKLRHIGDSLLLTPTLVATKQKHPHAEIWVLVRRTCDTILVGCPEIDRILTTANPDAAKRNRGEWVEDLKLAAMLRRTHFDFVFELTDSDRARVFALAARTPQRCTNEHRTLRWFWRPFFHTICRTKRYPKHQVVRDHTCPREVLGLLEDPPPLRFAPERMKAWGNGANLEPGSFAVVHFHTRWPRKSWPLERWETLLKEVLTFVPHLVLSCGPGAEEVAEARSLQSRLGERVSSTDGRAGWNQLAWLLQRAAFFIGVDTAAMHLAAAAHCPSVCLFGPSPVFEYHPWKVKNWVIRPQDWLGEEELKKTPLHHLMKGIPIGRVLEACQTAWIDSPKKYGQELNLQKHSA